MLTLEQLSYPGCGPINLVVEDSQCLGVFGESGCGKSLMLRAIADLDRHQGAVLLDDVAASETPAPRWRNQVCLLPADSEWWFDYVGEHFEHLDQQAAAMLGFKKDVNDWQVSRLSSGEKQRLALLRVLQNRPRVLLLDEPTANLDRDNTRLFETMVADYISKHKACALWVSHDLQQLQRVCNAVYELKQGQLEQQP